MTGAGRTGLAKIDQITTDIREALRNTRVILVAVVAPRHEEIAHLCAPFLRDDQIIVFSPGNAGSLILVTSPMNFSERKVIL